MKNFYYLNHHKKRKGRFCEALVRHELLKKNYKIIKNNYYAKFGEVDIIISKGRFVIFVEVKAWGNFSNEALEKLINRAKLSRMRLCAEQFLAECVHLLPHTRMYVRFDVILVTISTHKMVHYKGV